MSSSHRPRSGGSGTLIGHPYHRPMINDTVVSYSLQAYPLPGIPEDLHMKWITRERPKIDRIACPWLIRRFIDAGAEFVYVPTDQVFAMAKETGATPYDIPGAEPFAHDGDRCTFDALIKHYTLTDPALDRLALIDRRSTRLNSS